MLCKDATVRTINKLLLVVWTIFLSVGWIHTGIAAEENSTVETSYSLFNPIPKKQWRELSADRPDFTESPFTVDPGAFQLEMSFLSYSHDGDNETYTIAPFNFKLGLTHNTDLQIVFDPYVQIDERIAGNRDGIGDFQIRLKINVWENNDSSTGFGVMPYVKLPTAASNLGNDKVEGGIIVPFATGLADNLGLGLMFETDFVYDEADDAYDTEFIVSAVLGSGVTTILGVYGEIVGITSTDTNANNRSMLNLGATVGTSENLVFDAGINLGLTDNTEDITLFGGITYRFSLTSD